MMRKVFLFVAFVVTHALMAQVSVSGKMVTGDNTPIAYTEVVLFSEDNRPLTNALTDENGAFLIDYQKGNYRLEVRQFKEVLYSQTIALDAAVDLGTVTVTTVNTLDAVVVSKKKAVVERKVDRLVFNLENTIGAVGGDALEALRITPGVQVQNENISIIGRQGVRVLIDDRMVEMGESDLANFLRSIPADNIKTIEVITIPPAQYDAAGNSGLLNIKLKKAQRNSSSLSVGSSYLRRSKEDEGAITSTFMYSKDKISLNASFNYRTGAEDFDYQDHTSFPDEFWDTKQGLNRHYKRVNTVLGLQYAATDKWLFGGQYIGNIAKTSSDRTALSRVYAHGNRDPFNTIDAGTSSVQNPDFHSLNLFNEFKLDTLGRRIILNLDYFNYTNNDSRPYEGTLIATDPYRIQYFKGINNNAQTTNNYAAKMDVELPTAFAKWSTGAKISVTNTKNTIDAFNSNLVDEPVTTLPKARQKFDYDENIQAVYVSGNKKFRSNLEVQVGLRLEATQTKAFDGNLNQTVRNDYTKLFPTLHLSYAATEHSTYQLSYSKRLGRPNFAELNPNVTYITPFHSVEGNPFLTPYFTDNFEVAYSYKKLESKLFFSLENNAYNQIGLPNTSTSAIRLTYRNMFNIKRFGISESYIFDPFSWWSSYTHFALHYLTAETFNIPAKGVDGFYSAFSTNNDFIMNKEKTLVFNFNFQCMPVGTYGVNRLDFSSATSLSAQYLLLNKDLRITLRANDIFKTDRMRFNSTVDGVFRDGNYYFDSRCIQLSVSYKFGNKKVNVAKRQTGNEEERGRTGN